MKKIGIIIADEMEFAPFLETVKKDYPVTEKLYMNYSAISFAIGDTEIIAIKSRIGKVNAAVCATMLAIDRCDCIINSGYSGAVKGVKRGELIAGSSYIEADFDLTPLGYAVGEKPEQVYSYTADSKLISAFRQICDCTEGKIGCGDFFLTDSSLKEKYHNIFGIKAFDMESGAIASVCHSAGIPFASLRKVSDGDGEQSDAASEYIEMNEEMDTKLFEILLKTAKCLAAK